MASTKPFDEMSKDEHRMKAQSLFNLALRSDGDPAKQYLSDKALDQACKHEIASL